MDTLNPEQFKYQFIYRQFAITFQNDLFTMNMNGHINAIGPNPVVAVPANNFGKSWGLIICGV